MPQPIVYQDPSGIAAGITEAGSALAQALGQRMQESREQAKQRQYGTILGQTLGALPEDASPLQVTQALTQAVSQGVPIDIAQKHGTLYTTLRKTQSGVSPAAVQELISQSDFSTPEGQRTFLGKSIQLGLKPNEGINIIKEFKPSGVEEFLSKYDEEGVAPTAEPRPEPPPEERDPAEPMLRRLGMGPTPEEPPTGRPAPPEAAAPVAKPGVGRPPYVKEPVPFEQIPDKDLVAAMGSKDTGLRELAKGTLDARDREYKRFTEDRTFYTKLEKPYIDKMNLDAEGIREQRGTMNLIKTAIDTGDLGPMSSDWWADMFGPLWGGKFVTPEGALLRTGIKDFVISTLKGIKGRPNQYIMKQITDAHAKIGRDKYANKVSSLSIELPLKMKEVGQELYNKEFMRQMNENGHVQNLQRIVDSQLEPEIDFIQNDVAYKIRRVQEQKYGLEKLSKQKVPEGTPITEEMKDFYKNKYGEEKGRKMAKQLGYKTLSNADYRRIRSGPKW